MATSDTGSVSDDDFRGMIERAGLGMTSEEITQLKPLYDLYAPYIQLLHSIDFQAEEIGITFHPDWDPD